MKKINFKDRPNTETPISASNLNGMQQNVEDEFNRVENIGVTKLRMLTGICTGGNTSVQFPTGWNNSVVLSVEIKNANTVWVTQNDRYASNSGLSFYFTHNTGFSGLEYRVYILKTQNLGG